MKSNIVYHVLFIDRLDISGLGFKAEAAETGRPGYHPRTMLKIYVYGYLNQMHSSRRLERETQRNVELIWDQMYKACLNYGRKGLTIQAISAVDLAISIKLGRGYSYIS